jgi:ribosomal-protein-alanine N-acetyltransferase
MLRTDRVLLRPWRDTDLEAYARMALDPAVMEFLMPLPDRAASDAMAHRLQEHIDRHGFGFWAVELSGVCPFIGFTGLKHVGFDAGFSPAVEIGWRLESRYWGHGYATEAAGLALRDGFQRLSFAEIVALTVPANRRSRKVMERLGMTRTPEDDFDHPLIEPGHPLRRHVLYRLRQPQAAT